MAFNMNRPIIKGTPLHKASVAKAKSQSIVSQARTQGDAGLIAAADALGKSYKPAAIDFELDKINIDVPEIKKLTEEEQAAKTARKAARKAKRGAKELTPKEQAAKDAKKLARKAKRKETRGNIVDGVKTAIGGIVGVPLAIGNGLFKFGGDIIDELGNVVEDARTKGAEGKKNRADKKAAAEADRLRIKTEKEAEKKAKLQANKKARFDELMVEDEEENDFSAIDNEPDVEYETSAVDRGYKTWKHKQDEENIRSARETSGRLNQSTDAQRQDAAKKYNVKVEDLEAKHIGPKNKPLTKEEIQKYGKNYVRPSDLAKRQFYPKQNVVGGKEETQWDDKLGRFRKAEATTGTVEEQQKAVEEMKPKYPEGMDPNLEAKGEIALNYETNTYEYTNAYNSRIAREKIAATEAERANQNAVTSEPVVEEKNAANSSSRKRRLDLKYKLAGPSVRANMEADGYVPLESKSPMEMRDNRIYRNARADGPVRRNMIKGGYTPPN